MFSWLNRKLPLPAFSAGNPGKGTSIRVGFANAQRNWSEEADALESLCAVLAARETKFKRGETHLELENGLIARPQFVVLRPRDDQTVNTITTVEINHPVLCPQGTFEYQHAVGSTVADSLQKGFQSWADVDLPVFMDALGNKPPTYPALQLGGPNNPEAAGKRREVIFGPIAHYVADKATSTEGGHDFCPCCLFTNTHEAFLDQVQNEEFHGIRLFASRDAKGVAQADCRINGLPWDPGAAALLKYIATWPNRGFELRKQFVVIRTPASTR